ncbi:putative NADH-ubiquinone oxidoreductase, mitochondrial [Porphyridium purpureum]|uniref:Putative NADH-ubiquinone oxidoreductase, mitochondrial n=1 Tax=Porphyridium purpureum TaxID=35688 RepID=A0A5J4YQB1_PORPP|nr:putative NADH-ubiquinone oxidoreductase, mitochondrial [Porphyridium purpureum]|eukprot:POR9472..scf295_9
MHRLKCVVRNRVCVCVCVCVCVRVCVCVCMCLWSYTERKMAFIGAPWTCLSGGTHASFPVCRRSGPRPAAVLVCSSASSSEEYLKTLQASAPAKHSSSASMPQSPSRPGAPGTGANGVPSGSSAQDYLNLLQASAPRSTPGANGSESKDAAPRSKGTANAVEKPSSGVAAASSSSVLAAPEITIPEKREFLHLVAGRTIETIEDGLRAIRNKFSRLDPRLDALKPRVVVLGSGWAAHAMIKTLDTTKFDLIVVSPRSFFVFTPMLASSAVGTVEFRSVTEPIRQANDLMTYYEAECREIRPSTKEIVCVATDRDADNVGETFLVPYSFLVIAIGARVNTFGIPGVQEYMHFLKEVRDASRLRASILNRFERANLPDTSPSERKRLVSFVVIGAGPTGVELTGEMSDLIRRDLARFFPKIVDLVQLTLIEAGPAILMPFHEPLREQALKNLERQGVKVLLQTMVTKVDADTIYTKDGSELKYGLGVWAAGVGPQPLVSQLLGTLPEQQGVRGRLKVDPFLRVAGMEDVFAVGDCAQTPEALPMTGQVAAQQGAYLARLFNKDYNLSCELPMISMSSSTTPSNGTSSDAEAGEDAQVVVPTGMSKLAHPFEFLSLGILAYTGGNKAISQVQAGDLGVAYVSGRVSFWIWRSVYLTKQVSTRNRVSVAFDWMRSHLFGRM